jgi:hypothetical protein
MAEPALPMTGGCMCGGVRYEVSEPLGGATYCHCKRCQRRTGAAASAQARVARGSLRIVSGEELLRAWDPGGGYAKVFCSSCGSAMWSRHPDDHEVIAVRLGTFDDDPGVRPALRQFVDYAAPWEPIPEDGLPRHLEMRPDQG